MTRPTLAVVPPTGGAPPVFDPAAIPPLVAVPPAMITFALPDGGQAQIPGVLWPECDLWAERDRRTRPGAPPAIEIRQLTRRESNVLAAQWLPRHRTLGAERRPFGYHAFALFVKGEPLALATAGNTRSADVDEELGLVRANTIQLTRLCCAPDSTHPQAKGTLPVMLRTWREFCALQYWPYFEDTQKVALIFYSLPGEPGHIYINDGWTRVPRCRSCGGGARWSNAEAAAPAPDGMFVYWLSGKRSPQTDAVLARRKRETPALAEGKGRRSLAEAARRAA
jgi:hypothetical protein